RPVISPSENRSSNWRIGCRPNPSCTQNPSHCPDGYMARLLGRFCEASLTRSDPTQSSIIIANPRSRRFGSRRSHPTARPYVWMLCGSFSFTMMAELAHVLTRLCDWQTVAVFRAGLVAVFAVILARTVGAKLVFWPWRLWVRSVAGSCSMVCTFFAFGQLPAADVVTLTNTFPIWVTVLSWPLYGHLPGVKMLIAILVGVTGVVLVEQPHV